MALQKIRFGMRHTGVALLLVLQACWALAQIPDKLPQAPDYLGEIRRSPSGELKAMPEAAAARSVEAAATMIVGHGEKITTITEAARLAHDGEVIEIRSGEYRGQPATWTQNNLLIRGVGQRPVMLADGKSAEGKAIWVVRGGKVTIENIEFRGARVDSLNGAGIRFEKGNLTIRACAFFDNEMGLLTANSADLTLDVIDSEFGDAPRHQGNLHHLLYVGQIGKFVLRGSRFSNGYLGHLVKSRARENHILYNMLVDGAIMATTMEPKGVLDDIVALEVINVTPNGAYLQLGIPKDVFLHKSQIRNIAEPGDIKVVKLILDYDGRLAATELIESWLDNAELTVVEKEQVAITIIRETDLGYNVAINNKNLGFTYRDVHRR